MGPGRSGPAKAFNNGQFVWGIKGDADMVSGSVHPECPEVVVVTGISALCRAPGHPLQEDNALCFAPIHLTVLCSPEGGVQEHGTRAEIPGYHYFGALWVYRARYHVCVPFYSQYELSIVKGLCRT